MEQTKPQFRLKTSDFDYELPESLIAYHPPSERDGGRLMVLKNNSKTILHKHIVDLPELLPQNALLVFNDTRVFKARLEAVRPTGGAVEVLIVRMKDSDEISCRIEALVKANRPIKLGDILNISGVSAVVQEKQPSGEVILNIELTADKVRELASHVGAVPLPPYIKRKPIPEDIERYQTVYAKHDGSTAAPTAGLHFSDSLIKKVLSRGIEIAFVTLHVGPGTFRPVKTEFLEEHKMDKEEFIISEQAVLAINRAKANSRPVIAVGTTSVRALEGAYACKGKLEAGIGFTELFISPGYKFRVTDGLITNFHLPKSTLLSLVSAMAGRERILSAYQEAVEKKYRFYSYGDAMFIEPSEL